MRSVLLLSLLVIAAVNADNFLTKEDLKEIAFIHRTLYTTYNGFVRGLYRETTETIIDQRCLGDWMISNLTHIDSILARLRNLDFNIT